MVYRLLRPLLFRLGPETAHSLSLNLLRALGAFPRLGVLPSGKSQSVEAFGLRFPNRVGLAAGYDKDATAWRGLFALGFGHVEVGTVTPRPQPGNPRPRVFRLPGDRSLINRLGFPSHGADAVRRRLSKARPVGGPILGVNIGKQRETPLDDAADDYELLMERFGGVADYLTVNISSPNTPGLRQLEQAERLAPLLRRLTARRDALRQSLRKPLPLLVKLSPDLPGAELRDTLEAIVSSGVDGIVATNTTVARDGLSSPAATETGGLSGAALARRSTECVREIVRHTEGRLPVIACGGVMGPREARDKIDAGACLVQVYTGLVYGGPGLVGRIVSQL